MDQDDLPPPVHVPEEGAAGAFGELFGAGLWIALFLAVAGGILYFLLRAHG
jgi:hypothetical protein